MSYSESLSSQLREVMGILRAYPERFPELCEALLEGEWEDRMQKAIEEIESSERQPDDQGLHLLYALSEREKEFAFRDPSPFHFPPSVLEEWLQTVRARAEETDSLRSYGDTRQQLASIQANQIHSSLFELAVLFTLIKMDGNICLHPKVGEERRNVEAAVHLDERTIYCECTIRGFGKDDAEPRSGAMDPGEKPRDMARKTVGKKLKSTEEKTAQLALAAREAPTILFTCVGFDSFNMHHYRAVEEELKETNGSAVVVFERYYCGDFYIVENPNAPHPLTEAEKQCLQKGLEEHLGGNCRPNPWA